MRGIRKVFLWDCVELVCRGLVMKHGNTVLVVFSFKMGVSFVAVWYAPTEFIYFRYKMKVLGDQYVTGFINRMNK